MRAQRSVVHSMSRISNHDCECRILLPRGMAFGLAAPGNRKKKKKKNKKKTKNQQKKKKKKTQIKKKKKKKKKNKKKKKTNPWFRCPAHSGGIGVARVPSSSVQDNLLQLPSIHLSPIQGSERAAGEGDCPHEHAVVGCHPLSSNRVELQQNSRLEGLDSGYRETLIVSQRRSAAFQLVDWARSSNLGWLIALSRNSVWPRMGRQEILKIVASACELRRLHRYLLRERSAGEGFSRRAASRLPTTLL